MKRVLISMLCIVVMMCFMPTMAFADGGSGSAPQTGNAETTVAKIGDTEYATLAEAVAAAKENETVVITKDLTINLEADKATVNKNITIDGDGNTITVVGDNKDYGSGPIYITSTNGATIKNITFKQLKDLDGQEAAIYIQGGTGTVENPINIINCKFYGDENSVDDAAQAMGISTTYDDCSYLNVSDCYFKNLKYGMYFNRISNSKVENCEIDGTRYNAINIAGDSSSATSSNIKIIGNTMKNISAANYGTDIYASAINVGQYASNVEIENNDITMLNNKPELTIANNTAVVAEKPTKDNVIPAPLVDRSESPIADLENGYNISYDTNTVTINVKPQLHTNGESEIGKWVGIAVPVPESAATVDYQYSDREAVSGYNLVENKDKEIWEKDGKNYMSFSWDYAARNVEWIKYKFNGESKFHKVNIAVNAAPTAVEAAPLHDNAEDNPIADNALYSKYKVDYANGTATITVKGLKEHYNGQDPAVKGKWVGIAVPADCKEADTHLFYKYNDGNWNEAPLNGEGGEKWTDKDGKSYVSFYMNAATVKARTISYAFGTLTDNDEIPTTVTGVNTVKVNVVEESEYTGGGAAVVPPATDNVTNNPADKNTTADLTPAVKDNKAETTVDAKTADKIVDKAVANKSTEVIVDATGNNTVASSEVAIPEKTVKELAEKTDANLVIKTDNGKVDLDKTALDAVAAQAGTTGTVRLVVETVKTDENICHVDLKLVTSNGAVTDFKGGIVTVTITLSKELAAKDVVCVYINDNGIYTLVNGQKNADGTYTFTTGHFSEYAVMAKDEADKKIAEQLDTMIKDVNLKVRTSKTSKKNIKAVVSGDVKALTDAGYTVKYKFYRSEKKASKYVGKVTKAGKTYINTAGKKGTKYYYKAKALVYDGDKLVGQTVLTQCKYGVRTWSK